MRDPFLVKTPSGRVRIWPFGEEAVGIEFLDRVPPPFPGLHPKLDHAQKEGTPKKTEP